MDILILIKTKIIALFVFFKILKLFSHDVLTVNTKLSLIIILYETKTNKFWFHIIFGRSKGNYKPVTTFFFSNNSKRLGMKLTKAIIMQSSTQYFTDRILGIFKTDCINIGTRNCSTYSIYSTNISESTNSEWIATVILNLLLKFPLY